MPFVYRFPTLADALRNLEEAKPLLASCWMSWATPTAPPPGPRSKGRSGDSWEKIGSQGRAKV